MRKDFNVGFVKDFQIERRVVMDYIENNWPREVVLAYADFYKWQFESMPFDNSDHSIIVVDSKDRICGYLGLNIHEFVYEVERLKGAELTTWIIDRKNRGGGFAKPMIEFAKSNFDFLLGASVTKDALSVYLRLGFNYVHSIPRFVKILNFNKITKFLKIESFVKKAFRERKEKTSGSVKEYKSVSNINEFSFEIKNGFSRSKEYLKWRYSDHPVYEYKFFGNKDLLIVYRIEHVNDIKVAIILDFLVNEIVNNDKASVSLSEFSLFCCKGQVDLIEFYCLDSKINKFFISNGYIPTLKMAPFLKIPFLYNPVEYTNNNSYSLVVWDNDKSPKLKNFSNLYVTKSDCDMDRPNLEYIKKINHEFS